MSNALVQISNACCVHGAAGGTVCSQSLRVVQDVPLRGGFRATLQTEESELFMAIRPGR